MNLEIKRSIFLAQLGRVANAITRDYPAIKLTASPEELVIEAANSNHSIKANISSVFVKVPGQAIVDGKLFYEIIKRLDKDELLVETIDTKLKIKSGKSNFELRILDDNKFDIKEKVYSVNFPLETQKLVKIIKNTSFACSTQQTRMILSGVCLESRDNKLYAYGTDSFRLAKDYLSKGNDKNIKIVIPKESLEDLVKIAHGSNVDMYLSSTHAKFDFDSCTFETRLLDGTYPDIEKIINMNHTITKYIDKNQLFSSLERVAVLIDPNATNVVMLDFGSDNITISVPDNQNGAAYETIEYSEKTSGEIKIACSYKYLLDALKTFEADTVRVNLIAPTSPITLTTEKDTVLQLVLPVKY